ncbi:MAG: hypothetical protein LW688_06070 [Cryomorphaceae bacterium]|jgi:hypothetical protein|nr:hypothetical protein [Cryomorphaceae bacterium]
MAWLKNIIEDIRSAYAEKDQFVTVRWEIITKPGLDILIPDLVSRIAIFIIGFCVFDPESPSFIFFGNVIVLLFTFYFAGRRNKSISSYLKMRLLSFKHDTSEKKDILFSENLVKISTEKMSQNGWLLLLLVAMPLSGVVFTMIALAYQEDWGSNSFNALSSNFWLFLPLFIIYLALSIIIIVFNETNFVSRKVISVKFNDKKFNKNELSEWKKFLDGEEHKKRPIPLHEMNDILIIDVQKKLEIFRQRLENLSYEAVFLGALTFATFVQLTSFENIEKIIGTKVEPNEHYKVLVSEFDSIFNLSWLKTPDGLTENHAILLIIIGSLISSVFYVIVLMKRFSILKAIEKAQLKVEKAKTWNSREETRNQILDNSGKSPERFTDLIQMELASAFELSENIDSNLGITSFIRMLALYMFFMILLTSSYLIHHDLFLLITFSTIYGLVASAIMFGFKKRIYKLLMLKHRYEQSYEFKIVTK